MGRVLESISEKEEKFIRKQKVFFVATAAMSGEHHVNVSPKAPGTSVIVIDPHTVAYADLTGSGSETASHVLENGRMTLLFCNLEAGPPQILRLHGTAEVIIKEEVPTSLWNRLPDEITSSHGFRCIYILHVHRVSSSCGYSLPVMNFEKHRNTLEEYTQKQGEQGTKEYGLKNNSFSIDGLPSVALLRNKDKIIQQDLQEGYFFGKEVPNGVAPGEYKTLSHSKKMRQEGFVTFAVGLLVGSVVTSLYCKYVTEQA